RAAAARAPSASAPARARSGGIIQRRAADGAGGLRRRPAAARARARDAAGRGVLSRGDRGPAAGVVVDAEDDQRAGELSCAAGAAGGGGGGVFLSTAQPWLSTKRDPGEPRGFASLTAGLRQARCPVASGRASTYKGL